uniref:UBA domain-containing protein n=1 Tax=Chromera velia CCMP2878 TaxID=1169474 RepID=A0A0G4GHV6_9ALVE|mmetsp:Transcript_37749/g.74223  ORF Transcript_37749/g.74223 Transcript_37749/m.74223 type:complete len:404 (-) Transcript_37749:910-2121(-)|eukprot:Cvel_4722.t1-p1 / transcript=Cvel_4722.t1 / gene=Cvel_4722 / organism=Chromera_velia_CCMP2878 / gene_product=hypothetical protein / transcript_product=hypothetical protein / location=Cvel_scaffold210:5177-10808(-) / protein_length=403 / sequence_SO=supercontig / SO=protein_coding / is_pseudo=false
MSWIPLVSQVKSAVQALAGDVEGARQTQVEFSRTCPVVSQLTSLFHATVRRDNEEAKRVQEEFLEALGSAADNTPVVGHVKGAIHHLHGDGERRDQALKLASRSVGTVVGGAAGAVAGPGSAVGLAVAGGLLMETLINGIDEKLNGRKATLIGVRGSIEAARFAQQERRDSRIAGHLFDGFVILAADGAAGFAFSRGSGPSVTGGRLRGPLGGVPVGRPAVPLALCGPSAAPAHEFPSPPILVWLEDEEDEEDEGDARGPDASVHGRVVVDLSEGSVGESEDEEGENETDGFGEEEVEETDVEEVAARNSSSCSEEGAEEEGESEEAEEESARESKSETVSLSSVSDEDEEQDDVEIRGERVSPVFEQLGFSDVNTVRGALVECGGNEEAALSLLTRRLLQKN